MNMPRTPGRAAAGPTIGLLGINTNYHSEALIFGGARQAAEERGVNFIYFSPFVTDIDLMRELQAAPDSGQTIRRKIDQIADHLAAFKLDGLIVIGWAREFDEVHMPYFRDRMASVRLLSIGKQHIESGIPAIVMPGGDYVRELVRHLHQVHGRRRIGYIPSWTLDERVDSFKQELVELGCYDERLIVPLEPLEGIHDVVERLNRSVDWLIDGQPEPVDAILTMNQTDGLTVLDILKQRGIRVPEDIALATYEDSFLIAFAKPALTTIDYPFHAIGYDALDQLHRMIRGEEFPLVREIPTIIRYRDSCGCTVDRIIPAADEPPSVPGRAVGGNPAQEAAEAMRAEYPTAGFDWRELAASALRDTAGDGGRRFMEALWHAFASREPNNRHLDRLRLVERMRELMMPACAADPERFRRAETVWLAARFIADAADGAAVIRHLIDAERDRGILDFINQELLLSQSTEDVLRVLNTYLGWIGIPTLYLMMEETPVPGERRKTIFAFTDFDNIADAIPEGAPLADVYRIYTSRKTDRFDLIVTPLIVNESPIGLAWFEPGRNSLSLVHSFAMQIGKAFISVGMAEETRRLVDRLRHEIELRKKKEAELAWYADIDALTNLFNRRFFYDTLQHMTALNRPFAVFCIDIDGFKEVNDTFGHQTGDTLLVQIAGRNLPRSCRRRTNARSGGWRSGSIRG